MTVDGVIKVKPGESASSTMAMCAVELRRLGVKACTYHLAPPFHSQVGPKSVVFHYGYPEEVISEYLDPSVLETNPGPDYVMQHGRAMTWKQAIEGRDLSGPQEMFVQKCRDWGYTNGLAVPLFGPNSRNSFSSFLFGDDVGVVGEGRALEIINFAQSMHRKLCIIMENDNERKIPLSTREGEMLYWIARGKSNSDIAAILAISYETVGTFIKRLFLKLGVHGRVPATIEGLSRGIVQL